MKERYANDLEFREEAIKAGTKSWHKFKSKLDQDPEAYQLVRHKKKEVHDIMYREDAEYRWAMSLRRRLSRNERLRNEDHSVLQTYSEHMTMQSDKSELFGYRKKETKRGRHTNISLYPACQGSQL
jgi:hypothetical protein